MLMIIYGKKKNNIDDNDNNNKKKNLAGSSTLNRPDHLNLQEPMAYKRSNSVLQALV